MLLATLPEVRGSKEKHRLGDALRFFFPSGGRRKGTNVPKCVLWGRPKTRNVSVVHSSLPEEVNLVPRAAGKF